MIKLSDYKGWIQERAEDIVFTLFIKPFDREWDWDKTWERHKDWAYRVAMEHYKDAIANEIDRLKELVDETSIC